MRIDLVLATLGRTWELGRFLEHLAAQTHRDFRLIVVDQNEDDRVSQLLAEVPGSFPVLHLRAEPGLSHARNVALQYVDADLVAFPDDDCWYRRDLLLSIVSFFRAHPEWDGLGGRGVDGSGRPTAVPEGLAPGTMTRLNLWARVGTYTLFLRRRAIDGVGPFDEMLGLGSAGPWRSAEDLDYVRRCIDLDLRLYYDPAVHVYHEKRREHASAPDSRSGYIYGMGMGRALAKARVPSWFAAYQCSRAFGGALLMLIGGRLSLAKFHLAVGRGRVRGWLGR
jgi:glycosyltransferase involved in cell wall biosynthesis